MTFLVPQRMKISFISFCIIILCATDSYQATRLKRYSNDQRGEWSWNRGEQLIDDQPRTAAQTNWPSSKGDSGNIRGQPASKTNRGGNWNADNWSNQDTKGGSDMGWSNQQPQGNNKGSAYPDGSDDGSPGDLEVLLRGVPGMDFPNFQTIPDTDFDCSQMPSQGYYGDVDAGCQVFHICQPGNRKDSFLCPLGTIFNQKYLVCDWWFNVNCSETQSLYELNKDIYKDTASVTDKPTTTTEKMLPWSAQDLDGKRPGKSWNNQGPPGKPNAVSMDIPSKRGGKSYSGNAAKSWSQTDVQQKEVTFSWSTSKNYGSSSFSAGASNPTPKPIWYGIDGKPAKDQSEPPRKHNGLVQSNAPFGTRMKASPSMPTAGTWKPSTDQTTTTPSWRNSQSTTASSHGWLNHPETSIVPSGVDGVWEQGTTGSLEQNAGTYFDSERDNSLNSIPVGTSQNHKRQALVDISNPEIHTTPIETKSSFLGSTTATSLGDWVNLPETSIVPSDVKGVWEQETVKEPDYSMSPSVIGARGIVIKASGSRPRESRFQSSTTRNRVWRQRPSTRKENRSMDPSISPEKKWGKRRTSKSKQTARKNIATRTNSVAKNQYW